MVATVRILTSSSATSEYFRQDAGYYLRKGEDAADLRARRAEHRNASTWHGSGAVALGLHPGKPVAAGAFEKLLQGHVIGTWIRLGRLRDGQQRAPPGLRHHVFGPEVGVAGGTSADGGAPARRPGGHSRAQCGGARDARLDRGDTAGDPGLGPRHAAGGRG